MALNVLSLNSSARVPVDVYTTLGNATMTQIAKMVVTKIRKFAVSQIKFLPLSKRLKVVDFLTKFKNFVYFKNSRPSRL